MQSFSFGIKISAMFEALNYKKNCKQSTAWLASFLICFSFLFTIHFEESKNRLNNILVGEVDG